MEENVNQKTSLDAAAVSGNKGQTGVVSAEQIGGKVR
jgi:hypothetical protein